MSTKKALIIAVVLIIIGGLFFVFALARNDFNFIALFSDEIKTHSYDINEEFDKIYIDVNTTDVSFITHSEANVKVEADDTKNISYAVYTEDKTLKIEVKESRKWLKHIGFDFTDMKVKIYLPKNFELSLADIKTHTGDVVIPEELNIKKLFVDGSTSDVKCYANITELVKIETSTGKVELNGIDSNSEIEVNVTTGKAKLTNISCQKLTSDGSTGNINLKNVIAYESIFIERATGDISLSSCDSKDIRINTSTGDVEGTLLSEKRFITETSTGDVDVPNSQGESNCEIKTSTGDIKIELTSFMCLE